VLEALPAVKQDASLIPHTRRDHVVLAFSPWYEGRQEEFLYVSRRGSMRRIGIIGVGLLGSAVASRLLQHDFEVPGYDTRPGQLNALDVQGLRAATSIAEAAAGADVVLTHRPANKIRIHF
jgi:phosphoglycerate dehydrogenase-like enzyme